MKTFKNFTNPILVDSLPVHGAHALTEVFSSENYLPKTVSQSEWAKENENTDLGNNVDDVHNKLSINKKEFNKIPNVDRIKQYTTSSVAVNHHLIGGATGTRPQVTRRGDHDEFVQQMDKTLKHKSLKHDLHVYHGTSAFNPDQFASQHPQRKIKFPSYLSTSINKHTAGAFADAVAHENTLDKYPKYQYEKTPHILHIHLKSGQHGLYVGDHGSLGNEHEFIMPRNSTLKVHHEPTVTNTGVHIWHAHVVNN